jgi:serine/threonine protein kinase
MGQVYKAEHRLMKRVVALKLLGPMRDSLSRKAVRNRFRREIEAAGRLRHPNIVTAYDAGLSRGRLYLAMEYIEGIDLQRLVEKTGPLTVDLACEIIRQTAEALDHAHQRGLVHRDIKPSNLMLAPPGVTVKLLDLGLAQGTNLAASSLEGTEPDEELCGTPDFMAPEWGRAPCCAGVRGDLYSLGCTFYFLLTAQVPYPGGSWTEKLLRHSLDEPMPLRELRPNVPTKVAAVVEQLMAREMEKRYPDAAGVAADLDVLSFASLPTLKGDITSELRSTRSRPDSARRTAWLSCSALVAICLGVAAAGGARWMVAPSSMPPTPSSEPRELPFAITGRSKRFTSMAEAIVAAKDGDVLTIEGSGPFVMPPVNWESKALTLRAAGNIHPRLLMQMGDDPWQASLQTDRSLTLEGLDLAFAETTSRKQGTPSKPLIRCMQAPLFLTNCRLTTGPDGAAIVTRNASQAVVRGCDITAGAVGLSIEVGQGSATRIRLADTHLRVNGESGAALSLWSVEARQNSPIVLELENNTIQAARMAALRVLPSTLTITARGNRFRYRTALLSYSECAECEGWGDTAWQGTGNSFQGPRSWLWVQDKPVALLEQPPLR